MANRKVGGFGKGDTFRCYDCKTKKVIKKWQSKSPKCPKCGYIMTFGK